MKNIRKSIMFFIFIMLCSSFCFANEIEEKSDITVMTLDEAVDYALKHNANVLDINKMVRDQEKLYSDAKTTYRSWKNRTKNGGYAFETSKDYFDCFGYSLDLAELSYKSFLATKGTVYETVSYTVKNLAYTIDELNNSIYLLEKTVKKQENDVKIAEVKNSLNMITSLDVEATKQTLDSTKLQLKSIESTLDSVKANLKNLMGFDVSKELTIILPEQDFIILEVSDLAKEIDESLDNNIDAISAKISYKQKEMNNVLATKTHLLETSDDIKDAKRDFSDAEARLNNSLSLIKENLFALYNEVKNSEESVILAKSEYEQLQLKYNQMKVMYELGMITSHDFNSYEIALINAKNSYDSSYHKNILLNERWSIALKVGDVLAKEE